MSRVLLVDSRSSNLLELVPMLEASGHDVTALANGEAALRLARSHSFDSVITAYVLPGLDGAHVLERFRDLQPRCLRVLLIAEAKIEAATRTLPASQIDGTLSESTSPKGILDAVQELFRGSARSSRERPRSSRVPAIGVDGLSPGDPVGDYRVEQRIALGSSSTLYRVVHRLSKQKAALKVWTKRADGRVDSRVEFLRTRRATDRIRHPCMIDVHVQGALPSGHPYIVMEWLEGEVLRSILDRGRLPVSHAVDILAQLCSLAEAAHRAGLSHLGIEPCSILCIGDKDRIWAKALGFAPQRGGEPSGGAIAGSLDITTNPLYAAPELWWGSPHDESSSASDIYSLGILAYEILTGRCPFDGESLHTILLRHLTQNPRPPHLIRSDIPPVLENVILRMLHKQVSGRPPLSTIGALLRGLRTATPMHAQGAEPNSKIPGDPRERRDLDAEPSPAAGGHVSEALEHHFAGESSVQT